MTETYGQKRYRAEPAFRKKRLKYAKKYFHERLEELGKAARKKYANRTPKQIRLRKEYLKKLRSKK